MLFTITTIQMKTKSVQTETQIPPKDSTQLGEGLQDHVSAVCHSHMKRFKIKTNRNYTHVHTHTHTHRYIDLYIAFMHWTIHTCTCVLHYSPHTKPTKNILHLYFTWLYVSYISLLLLNSLRLVSLTWFQYPANLSDYDKNRKTKFFLCMTAKPALWLWAIVQWC